MHLTNQREDDQIQLLLWGCNGENAMPPGLLLMNFDAFEIRKIGHHT